eukprot:scaffold74333_cov57-Phaeocystis_antarctica.AAC.3
MSCRQPTACAAAADESNSTVALHLPLAPRSSAMITLRTPPNAAKACRTSSGPSGLASLLSFSGRHSARRGGGACLAQTAAASRWRLPLRWAASVPGTSSICMPHTSHCTLPGGPAFSGFSWRARLPFSRGTDCGDDVGWPPLASVRGAARCSRAPVRAVAEVARAPLAHRHHRRAQPLRHGARPERLVHEPSVPRVEGGIGHGVGGERQLTEGPARSNTLIPPPLGAEDGGESCLEVPCGHAELVAAVLRRQLTEARGEEEGRLGGRLGSGRQLLLQHGVQHLHIDHALQPHAVDHLQCLGVGPAVAQDLVVRGRREPRSQQPRDLGRLHTRCVHEEGEVDRGEVELHQVDPLRLAGGEIALEIEGNHGLGVQQRYDHRHVERVA